MELYDAIQYASKFSECDETDKSYIENNTVDGLLTGFYEEMGECIAAIGKYKRTLGDGPITPVTKEDALTNLKEEIADVLSTGILLCEKAGWLEECLDRHEAKSKLCHDRIETKKKYMEMIKEKL